MEAKSPEDPSGGDTTDTLFDRLLESVGSAGKFQRRFDWIYNFFYSAAVTVPYLNIVLALTVPDHWCHVPGRESDNYTLGQWKNLTLPIKVNADGKMALSSCQMFNSSSGQAVDCQYGYEYDRQWWTETAASANDWVCDREIFVSNTIVAGRIGETIGTFVFGQLGDVYGRRPVFYAGVIMSVFGRIMSVFTSQWYYLFLFSIFIGSVPSTAVFQSPLVISMETSSNENRSHATFLSCVGWVVGLCFLALMGFLTREWVTLMLITTPIALIPLFTYKLLPESPRWLASVGRVKEAKETLRYISEINGTELPANTEAVLEKIGQDKNKVYGIASLFTNFRLAKNSMSLMICWSVSSLTYYILTWNVTNTEGDPYLNFFIQSLVELPGYIAGRYFSEKIGRRWTQSGNLALCAMISIVITLVIPVASPGVIMVLTALLKLFNTCTFYMAWLQTMEILPTCVRQTGSCLNITVASLGGIFAPYIILLGNSSDSRFPYEVIIFISLLAFSLSLFLPETLNTPLPETLENSKNFGKDQKFFSFSFSSNIKKVKI